MSLFTSDNDLGKNFTPLQKQFYSWREENRPIFRELDWDSGKIEVMEKERVLTQANHHVTSSELFDLISETIFTNSDKLKKFLWAMEMQTTQFSLLGECNHGGAFTGYALEPGITSLYPHFEASKTSGSQLDRPGDSSEDESLDSDTATQSYADDPFLPARPPHVEVAMENGRWFHEIGRPASDMRDGCHFTMAKIADSIKELKQGKTRSFRFDINCKDERQIVRVGLLEYSGRTLVPQFVSKRA
ncbi:hypothetical protein PT974_08418 [Cladobotryum mycophilum]|uniref:Uncharacterized protein n=1 Tax=Cladobotryum mycophilum TaxID=491253 RepID=A0ABR0SE89_9HYPO